MEFLKDIWRNLSSITATSRLYEWKPGEKFGVLLSWLSLACTFVLGTIIGDLISKSVDINLPVMRAIISLTCSLMLSLIIQSISTILLFPAPTKGSIIIWDVFAITLLFTTGIAVYFYLSKEPGKTSIVSFNALGGLSLKFFAAFVTYVVIPTTQSLFIALSSGILKKWWDNRRKQKRTRLT